MSDKEQVLCDVCGIDMMNDDGSITVGANINIPSTLKEGKRLTEIFGKCSFKVCCACMLKQAGIKPIAETVVEEPPKKVVGKVKGI